MSPNVRISLWATCRCALSVAIGTGAELQPLRALEIGKQIKSEMVKSSDFEFRYIIAGGITSC